MKRGHGDPDADRAFSAWVARARNFPIERTAVEMGWTPRRDNVGGPCVRPGCIDGPARQSDRFSVDRRKNVFFCRKSGASGSPIDLVQHVTDLPFLDAVERVTGEARPSGAAGETEEQRARRIARLQAEEAAAKARAKQRDDEHARWREHYRERAFAIWRAGVAISGTPAQAYLRRRGIDAPAEAELRFAAELPLWSGGHGDAGAIVHRGPALLAAVRGPNGKFAAVHRTWIDLGEARGKLRLRDSANPGEFLDAKKVLGSKKGGSILLARDAGAPIARLFLGEGIETVLSAWCGLRDADSPLLAGAEFRSSVDLGNLSGRAEKRVAHPSLTQTDAKGRVRRVMVPGPEPMVDDVDAIISVPEGVREIYLIGDGDSEPFFTRCALERAALRFARFHGDVVVRLVMADDGVDLNDMRIVGLGELT